MRVRIGEWQADGDAPVPMGRWAWLAIGVHVGRFWIDAMQAWARAARSERAGQAILNAELRR